MRSLLDKIYKQPTQSLNQDTPTSQQQSPNKYQSACYYNIREIEQKILQIHECFDINGINNAKVVTTFEDVMSTLHGLINVVTQLQEDLEKNQEKLVEYEKLRSMVSQHSEIVGHIEKQSESNLNRVYEEKNKLIQYYEQSLQGLRSQLSAKQSQLEQAKSKIQRLTQQNDELSQQIQLKSSRIEQLSNKLSQKQGQIDQMTAIEDSTIKFENISKICEMDHVDITRIFIYSKLRKSIYGFLGVRDFCNLGLLNKQMYFICGKTWKKQFVPAMLRNKEEFIQTLRKDVKEYEKIFDSFPSENIRTNALKYLFFKIKPAAYMLPYFQEEEPVEKVIIEQKSKFSQISSFFKKKGENEASKDRNLSFQSLKNDSQFKQTQKRIETFFDKLFGIEANSDLKNFNQIMKKQLHELKTELKGSEKSQQLLCMSKYAYLEINQLNNLLQVCFALLLNKHNDLKDIKKKNDDLVENDKVLRNLVENIANDREQVEKRIFLLENQVLKSRNYEQRVEQELKSTKQTISLLKSENDKIQNELKQLREQKQRQDIQVVNWQHNWEQALNLIKSIPTIQ